MYATHAKLIQDWVHHQDDPRDREDNFRDVCRFVLLTIRMPLYRAVADFRVLSGADPAVGGYEFQDVASGALFGYKAEAWATMGTEAAGWYACLGDLWATIRDPDERDAAMLAFLVKHAPGLGFAKAGFVLQMVWGISGCLDTHNLVRFGIPENKFKAPPKGQRTETLLRKARAYNECVDQFGGTAGIWDSWCRYVAVNQPNTYASARRVSELHAEAFGLA